MRAAFYGAVHWWSVLSCLDEAFDAPDLEADRELCRAIVAGRCGLHPDGWGNHDPLPLRWLLRDRCGEEPPLAYEVLPVDPVWEAKHRRPPSGEIKLTCDDCNRQLWLTLSYKSGERSTKAMRLREMGARKGWAHIAGRDRCPECSIIPAPEDIGDGAGEGEGDKQHADGG